MKTHKNIFPYLRRLAVIGGIASLSLSSYAVKDIWAKDNETPISKSQDVKFLSDIQGLLTKASGRKTGPIALHIIPEKNRVISATPSSITLSYGFLKQLQNITQLTAVMAHMTAHISLDYLTTPPLPDDVKEAKEKMSAADYLTSAIRPKYPDETYLPEATGPFHDKNQTNMLEKPHYENKAYDYSVNKSGIIQKERELDVDHISEKILQHAGFCPSDYSRLLRHFYETPHNNSRNIHFTLDADQWPRLDASDRRTAPATCTMAQRRQIKKYSNDFDRLLITVFRAN